MIRLSICAGIIASSFSGLSAWNKRDFCQGWAKHYSARASELRAQASALARDEAGEYLMSAKLNQLVSEKYAMVVRHPWKPYPKAPLITPNDQNGPARWE